MRKFYCALFYFTSFYALFVHADLNNESCFGYVSYSTTNIGDDIQAIAAKQFLPKNCINIDRDFMSQFEYPSKVKAVLNGWYMHAKEIYWERQDVSPPEKSWPPSSAIEPLLISMHFTGDFLPLVFSEENISYLKEHGPVGARDFFTLHELQKRHIPCYFSGCLTLTLENTHEERDNVIYAVDIDKECVNYIKERTTHKVVVLTHGKGLLALLDNKRRIQYAEELLDRYRKAKCVITTRLHAALPCLAFETPVLLVASPNGPRFHGLAEHTRTCSAKELLNGMVDFNFENPPENFKTYIPIREELIKKVTEWVNKNSNT